MLKPPPRPYSWLPGYPYLHPQSLCYLHPPTWPATVTPERWAADSSSRSGEGPGIPVKLRYHSGPSFGKAATGNSPSPETERPTTVKRTHTSTHSQYNQGRVLIITLTTMNNCHCCTSEITFWCHAICKQHTLDIWNI